MSEEFEEEVTVLQCGETVEVTVEEVTVLQAGTHRGGVIFRSESCQEFLIRRGRVVSTLDGPIWSK